ncbi:MAG: RrF2 family transcriptional regulator [Fusobacteriota bacterium]
MKFSTKSRYGLRALFYISFKNDRVSLKEISKEEKISKKYLEQIFSSLKKSGLVISKKGVNGGYSLSKDPKEITLKEILESLEGSLEIIKKEDKQNLDGIERHLVTNVWQELEKNIEDFLSNITLEDLKEKYLNKNMYYI